MSKNRAVRILNAVGGSYTSRASAIKMLKTGRARLRPDLGDRVIEMIESDHRHLAALASANAAELAGIAPRRLRHSPRLPYRPTHEATSDARPGLPVLPPGIEWVLGATARGWEQFAAAPLIRSAAS